MKAQIVYRKLFLMKSYKKQILNQINNKTTFLSSTVHQQLSFNYQKIKKQREKCYINNHFVIGSDDNILLSIMNIY